MNLVSDLAPLQHGSCTNPEFCQCEESWFGVACDAECKNGEYSFALQNCTCSEGWEGKTCGEAICDGGCIHGACVAPETCECHGGFELADCSVVGRCQLDPSLKAPPDLKF